MSYNFRNDYAEGAHPRILRKLTETNLVQQAGYGEDDYCLQAAAVIRRHLDNADAVVHFLSGGTQTNLIVISSLLRTHEAVISAASGHIATHETGAIEATGHKVITLESPDGKLSPESIVKTLRQYSTLRPHVVRPRMVYISNATETGTIYTRSELEDISACCKSMDVYLFLDGARLAQALAAENNDLRLEDISRLTDVFYIGGTKNGALLGEALVFNTPGLAEDFDYALKQKGAMLAKGRLLGIQFLELFADDLYLTLATHANRMAMKIARAVREAGYSFLTESTTNQIFPVLPKRLIDRLSEKYLFYVWKEIDDAQAAVRLITSWATPEAEVDAFIRDMATFS
jgi:threonine aldolase